MFQTINGVQIRERNETKELPNLIDKRFEIEYIDNVYLHKLVQLDLININVKGHKRKFGRKTLKDYGRNWMFVVKHKDYAENRRKYAEVGAIIHDKIAEYLIKEYGYKPVGMRLMDCEDNVYTSS
ncbi:hypothetical protein [Neobacillus drentensis]|uniref:hypothetical protein n=1 Tax=Neobacillus drentensis TaxID=220684 RepID=UPI002FFF2C24